jgi:hypothetical protein
MISLPIKTWQGVLINLADTLQNLLVIPCTPHPGSFDIPTAGEKGWLGRDMVSLKRVLL